MKRDIELAKSLLEGKGYKVSKKMNEAGWMVNHPGYDPIGAPAPYNPTTDDEPEPHWVAHNKAAIEKLRKLQGAPADAIYDGESGYFEDPKNPDHYWDEKAKAYNWVFIDGKGWVNESKKLKETKYIAGYHKNPRGYGTARVDLKTFDTEEEVERYCRMMNYDTGYTDEYGIKRYIDYVVDSEEEVLKPKNEGLFKKKPKAGDPMRDLAKSAQGDVDDIKSQMEKFKKLNKKTNESAGVSIYVNKRNPHKFIEVHRDGHSHATVRQYIKTENNHKPQYTGDGKLHRWRKENLDDLLQDYELFSESKKMRESTDDRQQRRIVKSIADEVIRAKGQNNSTGTYDRFIRKMMDNWATSGQDRDFIKSAIEKSFDKEYGKKGVNESKKMKESYNGNPLPLDRNELEDLVDVLVTDCSNFMETTINNILVNNGADLESSSYYDGLNFKQAFIDLVDAISDRCDRTNSWDESLTPAVMEIMKDYSRSDKLESLRKEWDYADDHNDPAGQINIARKIDKSRSHDHIHDSKTPLQGALIKSIKRLHESTNGGDTFKVGDMIRYSMLYGGSVNAEVISRTNTTITVVEKWMAEDTWEEASDSETYEIMKDQEGNEYVTVWEYKGHEGVAYPPNHKSNY